ncbi:lipoprotein-releasing ABC transporter permease subunit [Sphingomonas sp. RT2P30]|uniref:lipoprotein-releasing ABC transporter permease subunit n=1 Tax=Parasphingomonas halimpatiens TaxID=3096162 RepID=UPI002FC69A98
MILSRYEAMIARRYLLPGKGEAFIFLVGVISWLAVTLGVAALVVVMSVMTGFRAELFDKIVGLNGHAVVQGVGGTLPNWRRVIEIADATPGVTSATPMIEQPLMTSYNGRVEAVLLRGMRVQDLRSNATLGKKIVLGSLSNVTAGSNQIAIGSHLAEELGATVGSEISLISPQGQTTPFGTVPRIVSFKVGAIFEIGLYDYDKSYIFMPLEDAQTLLLMGDSVGMIEINTVDPDRVQAILQPLSDKVAGQAVTTDWRQMNAQLFEALGVERVVMFTVLSFIILVAVFNILSSLIMLVRAKTRDIAILRTMGASRGGLMRIFITVGTTIGALGTLAGLLLAYVLLTFRQPIVDGVQRLTGQNLWDPTIRFLSALPSRSNPIEVTTIAVMALLFSFLATLYPAYRAASTDPVQVLRYE